jgi:parallel beta-helix repeat protein
MKKIALFILATSLLAASCGSAGLLVTDNLTMSLNTLASGASVKLKQGDYLLDETILLDGKRNITIDGNGSTLTVNSLSDHVIHVANCSNIRLINFKATHIEPSGPVGCTGNVLLLENSSDVLVEGCDLNGSGIVGIAAYNVGNLRVQKNHIHENSEYSIIYQGPSLLLVDNLFEKNGNGNVIYFSHVEKGGMMSWPPDEQIATDTQLTGLVMRNNTFK